MRVFLLSDLHLPLGNPIRLSAFGAWWNNHEERMAAAWDRRVDLDDIVLVPGDISWASSPDKARADLDWIAARPGRIFLSPGNHDRWWRTRERLQQVLPQRVQSVHNDWVPFYGGMIASVSGMTPPTDRFYRAREAREYPRAIEELEQLLARLPRARDTLRPAFTILMMHYPPCDHRGTPSEFQRMICAAKIDLCVYGHLHQPEEWQTATHGDVDSTRFVLGSADALGFQPVPIAELRYQTLRFKPLPNLKGPAEP